MSNQDHGNPGRFIGLEMETGMGFRVGYWLNKRYDWSPWGVHKERR